MKTLYNTISHQKASYGLLLFFILLGGDIASKYYAHQYLQETIFIIPSFVSLQLHFNTGIAFSLPVPYILQIGIGSLLLIGICGYIIINKDTLIHHFFTFIFFIAGALGNLLERILFEQVTDFIAIWKFPIFNLADTFLFLAAILWIMNEYRDNSLAKKEAPTIE